MRKDLKNFRPNKDKEKMKIAKTIFLTSLAFLGADSGKETIMTSKSVSAHSSQDAVTSFNQFAQQNGLNIVSGPQTKSDGTPLENGDFSESNPINMKVSSSAGQYSFKEGAYRNGTDSVVLDNGRIVFNADDPSNPLRTPSMPTAGASVKTSFDVVTSNDVFGVRIEVNPLDNLDSSGNPQPVNGISWFSAIDPTRFSITSAQDLSKPQCEIWIHVVPYKYTQRSSSDPFAVVALPTENILISSLTGADLGITYDATNNRPVYGNPPYGEKNGGQVVFGNFYGAQSKFFSQFTVYQKIGSVSSQTIHMKTKNPPKL